MAQYANQKTIKVNRDTPTKGKGQFLQIYTQRLSEASRTLSPVGFKLYLYFASNQDGYEKDYSPRDFANIYGVSYESARKAPQNLIENGYLIAEGANKLVFYEEPQVVNEETKLELPQEEKRLAKQDDGSYKPMTYSEIWKELKDNYPEETIKRFWNTLEVWG